MFRIPGVRVWLFFLSVLALWVIAYAEHSVPNRAYAEYFLKQANDCREKECPQAKEKTYLRKAIYYAPGVSAAYFPLAMLLEGEGKKTMALQLMERGARLNFEDASIHSYLGQYYYESGHRELAFRHLSLATKNYLDCELCYFYLGEIHEGLGNNTYALNAYYWITENSQLYPLVLARKAALYIASGDFSRWHPVVEILRRDFKAYALADELMRYATTGEIPSFVPPLLKK